MQELYKATKARQGADPLAALCPPVSSIAS